MTKDEEAIRDGRATLKKCGSMNGDPVYTLEEVKPPALSRSERIAEEFISAGRGELYIGDYPDRLQFNCVNPNAPAQAAQLKKTLAAHIDAAIAEEREACAIIADKTMYNDNSVSMQIRARK